MSASAEGALALLQSVAADYGATLEIAGSSGRADISIARPSLLVQQFDLDVLVSGPSVSAREHVLDQSLPSFCPDRHLNSDGTFCLGWGKDNPADITDEVSARRWWASVTRFLAYQLTATSLGRWPGSEHDRAHGPAAEQQAIAESAAQNLGPAFVSALEQGRLTVRSDRKPGSPRLELRQDGALLCRVSQKSGQVIDHARQCPCKTSPSSSINACGSHAKDLGTLTLAIYSRRQAEQKFIAQCAKSYKCCGTLTECSLRRAIEKPLEPPKTKEKTHERKSRLRLRPAKRKRKA